MMEGGPRPGWIIFGNNRERGESRNNAGMKGLKFELRLCELPRGSSLQSICSRVHIQWFIHLSHFEWFCERNQGMNDRIDPSSLV